ncbi:MAG TPA: hypothetical protein VGR57_11310 [Ktedonobacterales bacterium]|nr:hypothetical protein [Ktedonobacterales bacterium]
MRGGVRKHLFGVVATLAVALAISLAGGNITARAFTGPVTGGLFTTTFDGTEVNVNQYALPTDVYLNGGPGVGAPVGAAGLHPDGIYVFDVTEPANDNLLSTDPAGCRLFVVTGGVITAVTQQGVAFPCTHASGTNLFDPPNGTTVQLWPFNPTTNNGDEYQVSVTPLDDYLCPLNVVDCGDSAAVGNHGFDQRFTKSDNFKVEVKPIREIDSRFHDSTTGNLLDGRAITWTNTYGATNVKWSYLNLAIDVHHEAHVEAPENGTHYITVANQAGCTVVGQIQVTNTQTGRMYFTTASGPQTVAIYVSPSFKAGTIFVDITCA